MKVRAQIAMVLNLDKCIGCHTCSVTCKNVWTSRKQTETSLMVAKEAAGAASRAKSTFLATMSHELRTPLAAIIGYSELIQERSEALGYEKIVPHLKQIGTAAQGLNFLIGNILDLSKIEAERMDINISDFSVSDLVAEVVYSVQPQMTKNGTF